MTTKHDAELAALKEELLVSGLEDAPMLVHAWWEAKGMLRHQKLSEALDLAEKAISELVDDGLIELLQKANIHHTSDEWIQLDGTNVEKLLREYSSWVPIDMQHLYFRLTDAGIAKAEQLGR